MVTVSIPTKRAPLTYSIPENWNEMPPKALTYLGKYLGVFITLYQDGVQSIEQGTHMHTLAIDTKLQQMRIELLRRCMGIGKNWLLKRNRVFYSLYSDEVADMLNVLTFCFKDIEAKKPFTSFTHYGTEYFLPTENLGNITGSEFHFAEIVFHEAVKGSRTNAIALLSLFCRPKGKGPLHNPNHYLFCGDVRQPFNNHHWDAAKSALVGVADEVLYPFLLWFAGRRAAILRNYPEIFNRQSQEQSSSKGWIDVFRSLSNDRLNFEQVANRRLSAILYELVKIDEEITREQRRIEQMKLKK